PPKSMSAQFLGDFAQMRAYEIVAGMVYVSLGNGDVYQFAPGQGMGQGPGAGGVGPDAGFSCLDSTGATSPVIAHFAGTTPDAVALRRMNTSVVAKQVVSADGAKYEGKDVVFWNKGRDAMVTWGGTSLNCSVTTE